MPQFGMGALLVAWTLCGCWSPSPIPAATRQLVLGVAADWDQSEVQLTLLERAPGGAWQPRWRTAGFLGVNGLAWGQGLHGDAAPAGAPLKREGDGRAPAGAFLIGPGFGTGAAPAGMRWPYRRITSTLRCVDDPKSRHYNLLVDAAATEPDWSSAEDMLRSDELHRYGLLVGHNPARIPGAGSCIFFHLADAGATVGCTAVVQRDLAALLRALDPTARPVYVLLTRKSYRDLAARWGLPALTP